MADYPGHDHITILVFHGRFFMVDNRMLSCYPGQFPWDDIRDRCQVKKKDFEKKVKKNGICELGRNGIGSSCGIFDRLVSLWSAGCSNISYYCNGRTGYYEILVTFSPVFSRIPVPVW